MQNFGDRGQEFEIEQERNQGRDRNRRGLREDIREIRAAVRLMRAGFENLLNGNRSTGIRQIRDGFDEIEEELGDILNDL